MTILTEGGFMYVLQYMRYRDKLPKVTRVFKVLPRHALFRKRERQKEERDRIGD